MSTDFDTNNLDAVKQKYQQERSKRLRADGARQYRGLSGQFATLIDDPYVQKADRQPITETVEALVVGGGFGGILAAARLREAGVEDLRIVERAGGFGGTWYWNRYPGAQCDVESYIYLPLLEELGYMPTQKYVYADEIREHVDRIVDHYELRPVAVFHTQVKEMHWQEEDKRWRVSTDRGDVFLARFVVTASGPLNVPKLPGIPGIESFKGKTFHTSRWDYDYTGGDEHGGLTGLADKRVAIIGTGATAVQVVPHVANSAKQLYVFQRTASGVDERNNSATDPEWFSSLQPGWQRERQTNFDRITGGHPLPEDHVSDGWTEKTRRVAERMAASGAAENMSPEAFEALEEELNLEKMNELRARILANVKDPAAAEALQPWYRYFCKRPCFHDEYLAAFNRPNTQLVDTDGKGVEQITERGLVVDGVEYEVDCVIYATGFMVGLSSSRKDGYKAYGRDGKYLEDQHAKGYRTLHSYMTDGFPNLFFISPAQGGQPYNFSQMLEVMSRHVAWTIAKVLSGGHESVEPSIEAVDRWVATIKSLAHDWQKFADGCTPGIYNGEGGTFTPESLAGLPYAGGASAFFELIEEWRETGGERDLVMARS